MHKKKGVMTICLWSQGERMCVAPDHLFLLFRWVQKSEAVLKSLAIPDLSLEFQWLRHLWKLEFQFNHFTNLYFAWEWWRPIRLQQCLWSGHAVFLCL